MSVFGPVRDSMTKFGTFLPQHVKQATSLEVQHPNFMDLQTSWSKASTGESGMAASWPPRHAKRRMPHPWPQRLKPASRWSKLRCAFSQNVNFPFAVWSDFDFWQRQMLLSKPTTQAQVDSTSSFSKQITNPSQFCCNQLCRASSPLAACGDPAYPCVAYMHVIPTLNVLVFALHVRMFNICPFLYVCRK